ncbi:MAPEG family protein [Asticcacaulis sp. ZE23SCel15]|uniref:MAPEG family protein n=1 Tax=Asticcacaulis sp. ZE23SCel15 TaxID=3059027 RepID=UPI00265EDBD0|nr:MAPEG family protein [Asticcacaulis sp. ZE23SCel15]WKL57847.1 MAPEG family protein [Asticcacaulis sp. ZE23SCel15]
MTLDQVFILAFLAHFGWVALLYVWLTIERQSAVTKGEVRIADFIRAGADPERSLRVARNLSNQFELPMFALFAGLFIYLSGQVAVIDVAAAWLFLFGRVVHTVVQTLTRNVPLRGMVFVINFAGVVILMARVAWIALT